MFEPQKLHPVTIVYQILKQLKEIIFPFIAILLIGGTQSSWNYYYLIFLGIAGLLGIAVGIASWFFFTYQMMEGELRINVGIFFKKKRYIPFERIQSIDTTEGILHRPFNLVKVKIETAGGAGEAEAVLTAIPKEMAEKMRETINRYKKGVNSSEVEKQELDQGTEIYKISNKELLILATTSGGIGVVVSGIIAFVSQFEEIIPAKSIVKQFQQVVESGVAFISILIFTILLFLWIVSLAITILKYANFTMKKVGNDLVITRGILEKKQLTVPLHRIQAIRITENLLRQPFKLATVYIESAGGSILDNEASKVVAIPLIKKEKIANLLMGVLTEYDFQVSIKPVPNKSSWRFIIFNSWYTVLAIIPAIFIWREWGLFSLILLLIFSIWGYLKYRNAGWNVTDKQLTISYLSIEKNTVLMKKNRIQTLEYSEGIWQKKQNLASLHSNVASGMGSTGGSVANLLKEDVEKIYDWYSYRESSK